MVNSPPIVSAATSNSEILPLYAREERMQNRPTQSMMIMRDLLKMEFPPHRPTNHANLSRRWSEVMARYQIWIINMQIEWSDTNNDALREC